MVANATLETTFRFSPEVPSPERRQNERYTATLLVGVLESKAGTELCLVRNLSNGGLRASVYSDLQPGSSAVIQLKNGDRISGTVAWAIDGDIGLRFDRLISIDDVLSSATKAANGHRTRLPRIEIRRFVTVRSRARVLRGYSVDISQGGVKVELNAKIDEQAQVIVSLAELSPLQGVVLWSDDRHTGIAFNQLIPFGRLIDWARIAENDAAH